MKKKLLIATAILLALIIPTLLYVHHWKATNDISSEVSDSLNLAELIPDFPSPQTIYGFVEDSFYIEQNYVGRNQNLASIMMSYNVSYPIIHRLAEISKPIFDVRRIRTGNKYTFLLQQDSLNTPAYFIYEIDNIDYMVMELAENGEVSRHQKPVEIIRKTGSGVIQSSLWNAISDNNLSPMLAINLSDMYAWTVDFFGIENGDYFRVVYDEMYVDDVSVGIDNICAALFYHRGKPYYAFRYENDSVYGFFDENGQSLRKAFLKAPLNFSRISSRFSHSRFHPVLKISRPHHGVDYAAPEGTPVYAIGDGSVTRKGWDPKGGGNFLEIKHNSVYSSIYMHLSGFAKGLNKGDRVSQSQLIGYVGKTGLATGPHLDFRIYQNGSPVDPLKIEAPPVEPVNEENMPEYLEFINPLKEQLNEINMVLENDNS